MGVSAQAISFVLILLGLLIPSILGTPTATWQADHGTWTFAPSLSGPHMSTSTTTAAHAMYGSVSDAVNNLQDYTVEVEVTSTSGYGFSGLIFRGVSEYGYYVVYANPHSAVFEMWRFSRSTFTTRHGIKTNIAKIGPGAIGLNQPYRLKVQASGTSFSLYFNDVLQTTLTNSILSKGRFGLWTWGTRATFDKIKLNGQLLVLSPPPPAYMSQEIGCQRHPTRKICPCRICTDDP